MASAGRRDDARFPGRLKCGFPVRTRAWTLNLPGMDKTAIESLTAKERQALLLLAQGYRISEIGPLMGVTQSTVETHLKSARRRLGTGSSLLAARAVFGEVPPGIPVTGVSGMVATVGPDEAGTPTDARSAGEENAASTNAGEDAGSGDLLARLFGDGRRRNALSGPQRLVAWLLLSAIVAIGAFASLALPYLVEALHRH